MFGRRSAVFLTLTAVLTAAGLAPLAGRPPSDADPLRGSALYADVVAYSDLGEHRTGTPEDRKTSEWLAAELRRAGADVQLHPFRLRQFFPTAVALKVGGAEVKAFPLWWPKPTGPAPVVGPLAAVPAAPAVGSLAGKIALLKVDNVPGATLVPDSVVHKLIAPAVAAGAAGVVLVTRVPSGEYMALNAQAGPAAWPVPVVLVGRADEAALDRAAAAGTPASLLLDGKYDDAAEAVEVVGRIGRGAKTVVISTPSSGWFRCAGERGPGIALWLGLARWAARHPGDTCYLFVASSGHELGGLGVKHFVEHHAPKPGDVRCWLHLGAGIATYDYDTAGDGFQRKTTVSPMRRLYSTKEFVPTLADAFAGLPDLKPVASDRPGGEMLVFARAGYRYWGFAGGSVFHHQPGDVPDRITGPELLEPVGRAIVAALEKIK